MFFPGSVKGLTSGFGVFNLHSIVFIVYALLLLTETHAHLESPATLISKKNVKILYIETSYIGIQIQIFGGDNASRGELVH